MVVHRFTLLLLSGVGLIGCVGDHDAFDRASWAVVNGAPNVDDRGVVLLLNPETDNGCTGVAISKRVILTAQHCVENTTASSWRVFVGTDPSDIDTVEAIYTVVEIRLAPGGVEPRSDLAILLIQHDFEFPVYQYAFRAPSNMEPGRFARFVGYGNTVHDDNQSAGTRYERSGEISAVNENTITATVGVCYGDSGGPLFNRGDVVLGIAHRIENANCQGDAVFTRVDLWADMIEQALTDMGACVPTDFEEVCDDFIDNDCNGRVDDCPAPADADADADGDGDGDGDVDADADGDDGDDGGTDPGSGTMDGGCSCDEASIASSTGASIHPSLMQRLWSAI